MLVPGWPTAFRGSSAVAAGLVTKDQLRGPCYHRLFPDVYAPAGDRAPGLGLRSRAAYRLVEGRGVLSGYSAAEVLGASCGPWDAPAEVTVVGDRRTHPGLLVHRDRLAPGEITRIGDVRTTTPLRTAFDLGRRDDLVEAVVAVDALAHVHDFCPDLLLHFAAHYPRARGVSRMAEVLTLTHADRRAMSPMETRLRLLLVLAGLPRPVAQHPVPDPVTRTAVWLDLAYSAHRIGIEYEGELHTRPADVLRDIGRCTRLVDAGWRLYRYTKHEIRHEPERIVAQISRALGA